MKWLHFLSGSKKEEAGVAKCASFRSCSNTSTDYGMMRSGSDFNSQNVSDTSVESSGRSSCLSFSQRPNNLRIFTYSELKAATRNFSRSMMVGEGGFGCVYKGTIKSSDDQTKIEIAVKQLNRKGLQGHKEWLTEVNFLGVAEHPNLVKLIGYCADDDERGMQRLLVYEFMPNKSVEEHLSPQSPAPLSWSMRLRIALHAARGLAYLHEGMDFQIIFRDLKTSNILLDEEWNAKLSDFGLARQGPMEGLSHVTTAVVGTIGYAAPEYLQTGRLTSKSDIWAYGVVLYELITGRRPIDRNQPKGEQKLLEWVRPYLSDPKRFCLIVDPRLYGQYSLKSVQRLAKVANQCLTRHPKSRPEMSKVLEMVSGLVESTETGAPQPPLISNASKGDEAVEKGKKRKMTFILSLKEGTKKRTNLKRRISELKLAESWWFPWRLWTPKVVTAR